MEWVSQLWLGLFTLIGIDIKLPGITQQDLEVRSKILVVVCPKRSTFKEVWRQTKVKPTKTFFAMISDV